MKTLLAAALVLSANSQDETSLMQGLARRVDGKLGADPTVNTARSDATSQLMETATKMLKNGAGVTPDVVAFISAARNDIQDPMSEIVIAHNEDKIALMDLHVQFQQQIDVYAARVAAIETEMTAVEENHRQHQLCRKDESLNCGGHRECYEKMFGFWRVVKTEEQTLREIHREIHTEWCITRVEGDWGPIGDPWGWTDETQWEGPETSQSVVHYPVIDYDQDVRVFRGWSVEKFSLYTLQKTIVERAWRDYYVWVQTCAESDIAGTNAYDGTVSNGLESVHEFVHRSDEKLSDKTDECDLKQVEMKPDDCALADDVRDARREFGIWWHAHLEHYFSFWDTIQLKVHDRQREWETLKIVDCLLETVYTHVVHSIESGEPCPTDSSHPAQTESEINQCHVISYVTTDNLTICSDGSYDPPTQEHLTFSDGSLNHAASSHALTINYNVADDIDGASYQDSLEQGVRCHNNINSHPDGLCHWAHPLGAGGFHISDECAIPEPPVCKFIPDVCSSQYIWDTTGSFSPAIAADHTLAWTESGLSCTGVAIHDDTLLTGWQGGMGGRDAHSASDQCFTQLSSNGWAGCAAPKVCVGCNGFGPAIPDPAYTAMSQQCKLHEQHLNLGELDRDNFRCLDTWCTPASARCNGVDNCHDGSDEVGCDTTWETPAFLNGEIECPSDASADVHFTCSSGGCVPVEGKCNGQPNCLDGSDELGCSVSMVGVTLEASSGHVATVEALSIDGTVFHDRSYTFDSLGSFTGMHFVKTHNNDKLTDHNKVQMKVRLPQPMSVYITHSHNQVLPWLTQNGWTEVPSLTGVAYSGTHETREKETASIRTWEPFPLEEDTYTAGPVWQKLFPAGLVSLPGNGHNDGQYLTFLAHPDQLPTANVHEFDSRLTSYWDAGSCGAHGNDHNWGWCGETGFDCAPTVTVAASICATQVAMLHSTQGDGTCCSSAVIDGCNYAYFAQYRCAEDHEVAPVVLPPVFDSRLTAYWDAGGCGPFGNDHNWGWCGATNFDCASTVTVAAEICESTVATLHSTQGDGTCCSSVVLDGCNFAYFAQYVCEVATAPATPPPTPQLRNGNLEEGFSTGSYEYTHEVPGWAASGGTVSCRSGNGAWGGVSSQGNYYVALQGRGAAIQQAVGGHIPGHTYRLQLTTAQRQNSPGGRDAILRITASGVEAMNEHISSSGFAERAVSYIATGETVDIRLENVVGGGDQTVFVDAIQIAEAPHGSD